jgi:putative phage-type endonuclease
MFNVGKAAEYMTMEQGTEEWHTARAGKITASRVSALLVKGKGENGFGAGAITYLNELVSEVFTGNVKSFETTATKWGHDHEDEAREFYEREEGVTVEQVGFVRAHQHLGVSPDGLVGDNGLLEIKCPFDSSKIMDYHLMKDLKKEMPKDYYAQVQAQLWVTAREWCDFEVFDTRWHRPLCMFVTRIERDEAMIQQMEQRAKVFIEMVEDRVNQLNQIAMEG